MQVTQQQAIPYQFFSGTVSVTPETVTWPNQYEGIITGISATTLAGDSPSHAFIRNAGGDYLADIPLLGPGARGDGSFLQESFIVVPSGSELVVSVSIDTASMVVSGWLLNPPGSTILAE